MRGLKAPELEDGGSYGRCVGQQTVPFLLFIFIISYGTKYAISRLLTGWIKINEMAGDKALLKPPPFKILKKLNIIYYIHIYIYQTTLTNQQICFGEGRGRNIG